MFSRPPPHHKLKLEIKMSSKKNKNPVADEATLPPLQKAIVDNRKRERFCYAVGTTLHKCNIGGRQYEFNKNVVFEVFHKEDMKAFSDKRNRLAFRISDEEAERRIKEASQPDTEDI